MQIEIQFRPAVFGPAFPRLGGLAGGRVDCLNMESPANAQGRADTIARRVGIVIGAADEKNARSVLFFAELVDRADDAAAIFDQLDLPPRRKRAEQGALRAGAAGPGLRGIHSTVAGHAIHQLWSIANQDHCAAAEDKSVESIQRGGTNRDNRGDDKDIVGHLPHPQMRGIVLCLMKRQEGFRNQIDIDLPLEHSRECIDEAVLDHGLRVGVGIGGPIDDPVAFDRVQERHSAEWMPCLESHCQAGEMAFDCFVFLIPRHVGTDRGGVVALGLAGHGIPGEMVHADDHAQRGLPIALAQMPSKREIPIRDAIQFAHGAGASVLTRHGLGLLGGGEFQIVEEHVDARELEMVQASHGLAAPVGLAGGGLLLHHVAGQGDAVLLAPLAQHSGKGIRKALAVVVVETQARQGARAISGVEHDRREGIHEIRSIVFGIGLRKVIHPRRAEVFSILPRDGAFHGNVERFVGEDGGNLLAKSVAQHLGVAFMGDFDEFARGVGVEKVRVLLVVEPRNVRRDFDIRVISDLTRAGILALGDTTPLGEFTALEAHGPSGDKGSLGDGLRRAVMNAMQSHLAGLRPPRSHQELAAAEVGIRGHQPTRPARGPAVLVVEPDEHAHALGLVGRSFHMIHELIAQVGRGESGAHMDGGAADAHVVVNLQLPLEPVGFQSAVPAPKRSTAVDRGRIGDEVVIPRGDFDECSLFVHLVDFKNVLIAWNHRSAIWSYMALVGWFLPFENQAGLIDEGSSGSVKYGV